MFKLLFSCRCQQPAEAFVVCHSLSCEGIKECETFSQEKKEEFGPGSGDQTESELVAKDENQDETSSKNESSKKEQQEEKEEKDEETEPHNLDSLDEVSLYFRFFVKRDLTSTVRAELLTTEHCPKNVLEGI